jgi:hypothetical protein
MRSSVGLRTLVGVCAAIATFAIVVGSASAQGQFHGIAFQKGCAPTTNVGDNYSCAYQILNLVDQGQDALRVTGLEDVVHSAGGDVPSGNILGPCSWCSRRRRSPVSAGAARHIGESVHGCDVVHVAFGTSITTNGFSFYALKPGDILLPGPPPRTLPERRHGQLGRAACVLGDVWRRFDVRRLDRAT